jgi:hypothetical protein
MDWVSPVCFFILNNYVAYHFIFRVHKDEFLDSRFNIVWSPLSNWSVLTFDPTCLCFGSDLYCFTQIAGGVQCCKMRILLVYLCCCFRALHIIQIACSLSDLTEARLLNVSLTSLNTHPRTTMLLVIGICLNRWPWRYLFYRCLLRPMSEGRIRKEGLGLSLCAVPLTQVCAPYFRMKYGGHPTKFSWTPRATLVKWYPNGLLAKRGKPGHDIRTAGTHLETYPEHRN